MSRETKMALVDPDSTVPGLGASLRRARILTVTLGAAVIACGAIAGFVTAPASYHPPIGDGAGTRWVLRAALAAVTLINLSTAAYVSRAVLARGVDGEGRRAPLAARLLTSTVIAGAFAEAVALYGVVLTLVGGEVVDAIVFGAAALISLGAIFPRRKTWEARAREAALVDGAFPG